jgi:hypothetical protein
MGDAETASAESQTSATVAVEQTILQALSKSELDAQITTARAFPRSLTAFVRACLSMATLSEETAAECVYALPRRERDHTGAWIEKSIEGPSARLAEIVVSAWGNCRAGARVIEEGREFVVAQGVFMDLERNSAITYEVRRRITNKRGERFSADMIGVTANAACSIALRNAVFKGVPKALWVGVYDAARRVIAGDSKTLAARRDQALDLLSKVGVSREKVLAKLGVSGLADIGLDEIVTLRGLHNSIKEGEVSAEEAFAPAATPEPTPDSAPTGSKTQQVKQKLKAGAAKEQAELLEDNSIPHWSQESALEAFRNCTSVDQLSEVWAVVVRDFKATRRELPLAVEAAYHDRRETLKQKK